MIFRILDFYRLSDLECPDFVGTWMLHTTMFLGYVCNRLGTYFHFLVGIGALESCGTGEWLVFSWHL